MTIWATSVKTKKNNIKETTPPLLDDQGNPIEGEVANLDYVHTFFSGIFAKDSIRNDTITANRATISRIKKQII